jgi:Ca-activated chloride channel family protein
MFVNVEFAYPLFLYLIIPAVAAMVWYYWRKNKKLTPEISYSWSSAAFKDMKPTIKERLIHLPFLLRTLAIITLLVAMARPQSFTTGEDISTEGIDIVMLLDISGSMLAEDLKPNRLEAAKNVIKDFINERVSDRIGLVIFARESFTQCPLTIDYGVLKSLLKEVKSGMLEDGTAIGTAIANGVNRLKESKAKSKVMILLTDGVNNSGEIDPITAAQIADKFGIRIYTIGLGTEGMAPYPVQTPFGVQYQNVPVQIDEKTLKQISAITDGKYFRATSNSKLRAIYKEIDKLEKSKINVTSYRHAHELFYSWLGLGLLFLFAELILRHGYLKINP